VEKSNAAQHPAAHLRLVRDPEISEPPQPVAAPGADTRINELERALLHVALVCGEQPAVLTVISDAYFGSNR
jgi:hypothetical protein